MKMQAHHIALIVACMCVTMWSGIVFIQYRNSPDRAPQTSVEAFRKGHKVFVLKYDVAGTHDQRRDSIVTICRAAEEIAVENGWQKMESLPPVEHTPYIECMFYGDYARECLYAHNPRERHTAVIHPKNMEVIFTNFLHSL